MLLAALPAMAEPGAGRLDPTFGDGGKVIKDFAGNDVVDSVVVQPDGKLVVAGTGGSKGQVILVRYGPGGALDETFGNGGVVIADARFGTVSLVLQPDGKLVATGESSGGSSADFVLVRFRPDGSPDTTFGEAGMVSTDVTHRQEDDYLSTLVLQPDGKLVAGGATGDPDYSALAIVRYLPDGTVDETFGTGGRFVSDFGETEEVPHSANALAIQSDGKLVAVDRSTLLRFHPDGTLDETFGSRGMVANDGPISLGADLDVQPDGKIVATGVERSYSSPGSCFLLARFEPDGRRDGGFGAFGRSSSWCSEGAVAADLALQPDGKLVVAGSSVRDGYTHFAVARYQPDGTPDSGFGDGGRVVTTFSGGSSAHSVALQGDGRVVVAGGVFLRGGYDFAVARYLSFRTAALEVDGR